MDLACDVEKNLDYYGVMVATSDFDVAIVTLGHLYYV
jgi:hypothetical protein